MSEPIIRVENLSKRYVLSHQGSKGDGLRHRMEDFARSPIRWLRAALKASGDSKNGNGALKTLPNSSTPAKEEFWALKDVSFEVTQGEVVGIIGRNGAGKSTLLKILSRITEPTSGRVVIDGRVASLLEVGTGFHPELTGRENIFLNGAILGMSKVEIKRKFDEIVAFAEIEKFLDTPVKRYSSGMYVRLAFTVAAHLEPEILIVDEVLAVGDSEFQRKCIGKMRDVAGHGRTVLFVSHNMFAVQALCARGILLAGGRVRADGPVAAVVDQYLAAHAPASFSGGVDGDSPRILSVNLLTAAPKTNVSIDIEVKWYVPRPIPGIKVGVGFNTVEGQRIFDCGPEDLKLETPQTVGQHRAVISLVANTLLARTYHISAGLWRESVSFHHVLPALALTVEAAPEGPYSHQSTRDGFVHINLEWKDLK